LTVVPPARSPPNGDSPDSIGCQAKESFQHLSGYDP